MAVILEEIPKAQIVMLTLLAQDYDILKIYKLNQQSDEVLTSGNAVRKCRFCGNTERTAKFRKRAHAIYELCGSHHLLSDYECDNCNSKFSKYERESLVSSCCSITPFLVWKERREKSVRLIFF